MLGCLWFFQVLLVVFGCFRLFKVVLDCVKLFQVIQVVFGRFGASSCIGLLMFVLLSHVFFQVHMLAGG